jgi:hypothetical protein
MGFKLTNLVVIGIDCTGSCKSNYHTITTTTALTVICGINVIKILITVTTVIQWILIRNTLKYSNIPY